MKFAVFDLDHTLLPVDSGENWSRWLVRAAGMDVALMDARIEAYAEACLLYTSPSPRDRG